MSTNIKNFFGEKIFSPIEIITDDNLTKVLYPIFISLCLELDIDESHAQNLANFIWTKKEISSILKFEINLRNQFDKIVSNNGLSHALEKRAHLIFSQIQDFIIGDTIGDIGCGDGLVAMLLQKKATSIFLIDLDCYLDKRVSFPFYRFSEGSPLNLEKEPDTSLLITVLHHAKNPLFLLEETKRITKSRIIIIESVIGVERRLSDKTKSFLYGLDIEKQRKYASFFDWFYNRIIHKDVPVPYNYQTILQWGKIFEDDSWEVTKVVDLGVEQKLVPEHHVLFVVDKKKG